MEAKSKSSTVRVSSNVIKYVDNSGKMMKFPLLMGNSPRISAIHTGKDSEFLGANRGKLHKLQHIFA